MSTTIKASLRFTLLAYSVYCWVDGSARARTGLGSSFDIDVPRESDSQPNLDDPPHGWKKIWDWLQRRGSRMSEEEQGTIGRVDAIVSTTTIPTHENLTSR